jgi:hypothetical protein
VNPTKRQWTDEGCRYSFSSAKILTERLSSTLLSGPGSCVFEGCGQRFQPSQRQHVDVSPSVCMTGLPARDPDLYKEFGYSQCIAANQVSFFFFFTTTLKSSGA